MKYNPPTEQGQSRKLYDLDRGLELLHFFVGDDRAGKGEEQRKPNPFWQVVMLWRNSLSGLRAGVSFGEWAEYSAEQLLSLLEYIRERGKDSTFSAEDVANIESMQPGDDLQKYLSRLADERITKPKAREARNQIRARRNELAREMNTQLHKAM